MALMTLQVPGSQIGWFEQMVRTMGWSFQREDAASVDDAQADSSVITPVMRRRINKARREMAAGETVSCKTMAEMQQYFDSL